MISHEQRAAADGGATGLGERRRSTRTESEVGLRVILETSEFAGRAENTSQAGVFFFSNAPLRVRVEIMQDGKPQTFTGQLVRVERLSKDSTGFAIEFDR